MFEIAIRSDMSLICFFLVEITEMMIVQIIGNGNTTYVKNQ
jgi:hypothetical protein